MPARSASSVARQVARAFAPHRLALADLVVALVFIVPVLRPPLPPFARVGRCEVHGGMANTEPRGCVLYVPGGRFRMGAQHVDPGAPGYDAVAGDDEGPVHEVRVSSFFLLLSEVTVEQYRTCIAAGACNAGEVAADGPNFNFARQDRHLHPINGVSWKGAGDFCAWIGGRLPTEAEWEYAARGGDGRRYPWGDEEASCDYAHFQPPGGAGCGSDGTQEVWLHPRRGRAAHALVDMAGNVWEWTGDWYGERYYATSPSSNPRGPESGDRRVQRGGAFSSTGPTELRSAGRAALDPTLRLDDIGFRCALPAPLW